MIHTALHSIKSRNIDSRKNIVLSICKIESGHTYNVFPDEAIMQGTIRSYDDEILQKMKDRINQICTSIAAAYECEADVNIWDFYPAVINHKDQTNHVIRLAKKYFGEENFSQDELPLSAGEDFSYYLQ